MRFPFLRHSPLAPILCAGSMSRSARGMRNQSQGPNGGVFGQPSNRHCHNLPPNIVQNGQRSLGSVKQIVAQIRHQPAAVGNLHRCLPMLLGESLPGIGLGRNKQSQGKNSGEEAGTRPPPIAAYHANNVRQSTA